MKPSLRAILFIFAVVLLTACSSAKTQPTRVVISPSSTPFPSSTVTSVPSSTPIPSPTYTTIPSSTSTRTPTPVPATPTEVGLALPTGKPVASWNGIPIMPKAIAGNEGQAAYSYTIKASVAQLQDFYDRAMPKAGWQPFAVGRGDTGNLMLMYQKGTAITTVMIVVREDITLVMIYQT